MDTADFLWNIGQQKQISNLRGEVDQASRDARWARTENLDLHVSLERLALTCRAMWELVSEQLSISEEDLVARVKEIDLRDGRLDGRMSSGPKSCPSCSRVNGAHRARCLYCAAPLDGPPAFEPG